MDDEQKLATEEVAHYHSEYSKLIFPLGGDKHEIDNNDLRSRRLARGWIAGCNHPNQLYKSRTAAWHMDHAPMGWPA